MNTKIPDKIDNLLAYDKALCMCFSRYGNLLAAGTLHSEIALWDADSLSIAIRLGAHSNKTQAVTSVSFPFPRTGVTVLATHEDGLVRFWDTLPKDMIAEIDFGVSINSAEPHPKHTHLAVIVPSNDVPVLVELRTGFYKYSDEAESFSLGPRSSNVPRGSPEVAADQRRSMPQIPLPVLLPPESQTLRFCKLLPHAKKKTSDKSAKYFVKWSHDGTRIIRASSTGFIDTFSLDTENVRMSHVSRCVLGQHIIPILSMCITKKGDHLLVSCQDKALRLMATQDIMDAGINANSSKPKIMTALQTFREVVSGNLWRCASFSGDGETVAGSIDSSEQKISLFNVNSGMIKCTLEGPVGMISEMVWHPRRCAMATIDPRGVIYLWGQNVSENYSAFASDFVELEANVMYSESEEEFDGTCAESDEEEAIAREEEEKSIFVDVLGNKDLKGLERDDPVPGAEPDDDEAPLFFVPAYPDEPLYAGVEKDPKRVGNCGGNGRKKRSRPTGVVSASGPENGSRDASSPMQTTGTYLNANGRGANGVRAHHHDDAESGRPFGSPPRHR